MRSRVGAVGLLLMLLLAACQFGSDQSGGTEPEGAGSRSSGPSGARATVSVSPTEGARQVRPDRPVEISVTDGILANVAVTDARGQDVGGSLSKHDTQWRSTGSLELDTKYVVRVTTVDEQDRRRTRKSSFRTLDPSGTLTTAIAPLDGETVGVGMPVQVRLSAAVSNRAAIEKALTVRTQPEVTGSWHWVNDQMLRYRPRKFWRPGTKVTVDVDLSGVDAGDGVWGDETRDVSFRIGPAMISKIDDATQKMRVRRNGELVRTIPISDGSNGFRTRAGTKVIMLKHRTYDMNSSTIGINPNSAQGYDLADVPYAMRLTNSGEFLHAAPWNAGKFGRVRASHGCVGMSLPDARWLYRHSLRGDVVRVVGSPASPAGVSNGYGGWKLSWSQWQAGSALRG